MAKKEIKTCQKLGQQIRGLRIQRGMSQESLAFTAGIHRTYIGAIERGERNPSLKNIYRIAKALQTPLALLFSYSLPIKKCCPVKCAFIAAILNKQPLS